MIDYFFGYLSANNLALNLPRNLYEPDTDSSTILPLTSFGSPTTFWWVRLNTARPFSCNNNNNNNSSSNRNSNNKLLMVVAR